MSFRVRSRWIRCFRSRKHGRCRGFVIRRIPVNVSCEYVRDSYLLSMSTEEMERMEMYLFIFVFRT